MELLTIDKPIIPYRSKYARKLKLAEVKTDHKIPTLRIAKSDDINRIVSEIHIAEGDNIVEYFYVLFLNRLNKVLAYSLVSQGGITGTVADPRIIMTMALNCGAVSIVLAHNHPSGSLRPSRADEQLTEKIKSAGAFMDIIVLDHVILSGEDTYYSFRDEGLL